MLTVILASLKMLVVESYTNNSKNLTVANEVVDLESMKVLGHIRMVTLLSKSDNVG